jgi:hypothetical protein
MSDGLRAVLGIELLEIRHRATAHHHAAHLIAALRLGRMSGPGCVFEKREQVGIRS